MKQYKIFIFAFIIFAGICSFNFACAMHTNFLNNPSLQPMPQGMRPNFQINNSANLNPASKSTGQNNLSGSAPAQSNNVCINSNCKTEKNNYTAPKSSSLWLIIILLALFLFLLYNIRRESRKNKNV